MLKEAKTETTKYIILYDGNKNVDPFNTYHFPSHKRAETYLKQETKRYQKCIDWCEERLKDTTFLTPEGKERVNDEIEGYKKHIDSLNHAEIKEIKVTTIASWEE